MANVKYSTSSPYASTNVSGNYLDVMVNRPITKRADDVLYEIDKVYDLRPDILAFDLYGDSRL